MKNQKILYMALIVLLFVAAIIGYFKVVNTSKDALKFKNEYEKLNDKYYKVTISNNNKIKYSSYSEITKLLKSDNAIIYLGYPEDNNSRYAINTLLKVIEDNSIDTNIYYLDIHNDRDSFVVEDGKVVYEKDLNGNEIKGTKDYLKLVDELDQYLYEYTLYFDDTEYDTGKKRINIPAIIFIKNSKILSIEYASVDIDYESLYSTYEYYILDMSSDTCEVGKESSC